MFNVLTNRYDTARTGSNPNETILNQDNVNVNDFGKVLSRGVDGQIYAQPLIVSNLEVPRRGKRPVVFVATTRNMVYAFDAQDPREAHPIWRVNLDGPLSTPVPRSDFGQSYTDFTSEIGITSTPVIDLPSHTIYLTSKTRQYKRDKPHYLYKLFALDIRTGAKRGSPATIAETAVLDLENNHNAAKFTYVSGPSVKGTGMGSKDGVVHFNAFVQLQRTGLLLDHGVLYMGFGSHGDYNNYHGWIFAYDAKTLRFLAVYCTTPDWARAAFGSPAAAWQRTVRVAYTPYAVMGRTIIEEPQTPEQISFHKARSTGRASSSSNSIGAAADLS